jgi:hypothetical protein
MKRSGGEQLDSVLARSLKNENDLLRFQLNDIIAREKHQVPPLSLMAETAYIN